MTNLKGVSSLKLHRDITVAQKTTWFMFRGIHEAWKGEPKEAFEGSVEIDETFIGGKRANMSNKERRRLRKAGMMQGLQGKIIAIGAKNRETGRVTVKVIYSVDGDTLRGIVEEVSSPNTLVYTDEARGYKGIEREHGSVNYSVSEYVQEMAHVNGVESFWSMLKRGYHGVCHYISPEHLERYIGEYAGRHNFLQADAIDQLMNVVTRLFGTRILYRDLVESGKVT